MQDCSISSTLAMEIMQSCTKPSFRWFSPRLQYCQCIGNGDTAVLHWVIDLINGLFFCMMTRHDMEMFFASLAICERNPSAIGGCPAQMVRNTELWCFCCYRPDKSVEKTVELSVNDLSVRWHGWHYLLQINAWLTHWPIMAEILLTAFWIRFSECLNFE